MFVTRSHRQPLFSRATARPLRVSLGLLVALLIASSRNGIAGDRSAAGTATANRPPNIVLILADDLGYGDLGSYGAADLRTPHLDRLVQRGIRLDQFYANSPVCSPTRASLLTGRYPELVGVPGVIRTHPDNSWGKLDPQARLLPQLLKRAGYHSAIVGKWHLGLEQADHPLRRGFDRFHGFLGDMMDDYYKHRRHGVNYMRRDWETIDPAGHATDLFTEWANQYLRERAQDRTRPFFLYLAYNAPHTPIQPPTDWLQKVTRREPRLTPARAKLAALIEHLDQGIGQVLKTLDETELTDNTIVIFTSDNGGQLSVGANNGPLRDGKQSMYEGGLKVPCCVVWPGKLKPRREMRMGVMMDWLPTLCEWAGVEVTHPIDGRSLAPLLEQETDADRVAEPRAVFFHRREGGLRYGGLTIQAVRKGPWKLLQNSPFAPLELYNLGDDPQESTNLAEQNRGKFRELAEALQKQLQRGGAVPWQPRARRDD